MGANRKFQHQKFMLTAIDEGEEEKEEEGDHVQKVKSLKI